MRTPMPVVARRAGSWSPAGRARAMPAQLLVMTAVFLPPLAAILIYLSFTLNQILATYRVAQGAADAATIAGASQWDVAASIVGGSFTIHPDNANSFTRQYIAFGLHQLTPNLNPASTASGFPVAPVPTTGVTAPSGEAQYVAQAGTEVWVVNMTSTGGCTAYYYPPSCLAAACRQSVVGATWAVCTTITNFPATYFTTPATISTVYSRTTLPVRAYAASWTSTVYGIATQQAQR